MNACPSEGDLLLFLDGELNADEDARIVAHVEHCIDCPEWRERLTKGYPAPAEGAPVKMARTDAAIQVASYQDRATMLIPEALKRLPADQRASFWRDSIQSDPTLRALRRRIASPELAGAVTSAASRWEGTALSEPAP